MLGIRTVAMALRTWQPVDGTPHLGYSGTWLRDPVTGIWYHMATIKLPMAVTGVTGSDGFQENASGGTQPQRTDYRNCYYHRSGTWNAASRFQIDIPIGRSAIQSRARRRHCPR